MTHYEAELKSSVVTLKVSRADGQWKRPERRLHLQLLLGGFAMVLQLMTFYMEFSYPEEQFGEVLVIVTD